MARPVEVTQDRDQEPIITLRPGGTVDPDFARALAQQGMVLTTEEAARERWLAQPLTPQQAEKAVGRSWRWLLEQVKRDPTFPHMKAGVGTRRQHVLFTGQHIEEIRARLSSGELRHAKPGRPPRRQAASPGSR
jgi:hypothetical protein